MQRRGCTVLGASYTSCRDKERKRKRRDRDRRSDKGGARQEHLRRRQDETTEGRKAEKVLRRSLLRQPATGRRSCVRRSLGYSIYSSCIPRIYCPAPRLAAPNKDIVLRFRWGTRIHPRAGRNSILSRVSRRRHTGRLSATVEIDRRHRRTELTLSRRDRFTNFPVIN